MAYFLVSSVVGLSDLWCLYLSGSFVYYHRMISLSHTWHVTSFLKKNLLPLTFQGQEFLSFLLFFFWPCHVACAVSVPWAETEPRAVAVKAWNPNRPPGDSQELTFFSTSCYWEIGPQASCWLTGVNTSWALILGDWCAACCAKEADWTLILNVSLAG